MARVRPQAFILRALASIACGAGKQAEREDAFLGDEGKDADMAYDEELADRVRAVVADRDDVDEKPMFGGLCLLAHGNMFAGVQSTTLMLRVGPERHEEALDRPHARVMDFTGRPMRGYVYVDPPGIATEAQLREWVELSLAFVDSLPAK